MARHPVVSGRLVPAAAVSPCAGTPDDRTAGGYGDVARASFRTPARLTRPPSRSGVRRPGWRLWVPRRAFRPLPSRIRCVTRARPQILSSLTEARAAREARRFRRRLQAIPGSSSWVPPVGEPPPSSHLAPTRPRARRRYSKRPNAKKTPAVSAAKTSVGRRTEEALRKEGGRLYIGIGTVLLIVIVVLIVIFVPERLPGPRAVSPP